MKAFRVLFIMMLISLTPAVNRESYSAYAGHTIITGAYCTCGDAGCIYDPGECGDTGFTSPGEAETDGLDFGSSTMLLLAAMVIVYRLRG